MGVTGGGRRTHVFTSVTLQGRSSRVFTSWHFGRKMSLVPRDRKVLKPPLGNRTRLCCIHNSTKTHKCSDTVSFDCPCLWSIVTTAAWYNDSALHRSTIWQHRASLWSRSVIYLLSYCAYCTSLLNRSICITGVFLIAYASGMLHTHFGEIQPQSFTSDISVFVDHRTVCLPQLQNVSDAQYGS